MSGQLTPTGDRLGAPAPDVFTEPSPPLRSGFGGDADAERAATRAKPPQELGVVNVVHRTPERSRHSAAWLAGATAVVVGLVSSACTAGSSSAGSTPAPALSSSASPEPEPASPRSCGRR